MIHNHSSGKHRLWRKVLSVCIAFAMICSVSISAFAVEASSETKVNNVKSNEAKGTTNSEKATQAFVNDKSSEIDTGVNLTTLPYILVFAGVIVIAGAAFITRRRKYED